jgi:hypothetical protein
MTTHHDTEDGFHEIQLSGKQLVFLFMAATTVAVAIFLCGVQVGRGVKTDRAADSAESLVASATPPPAASAPSQPAAAGGPPAAEPPAPAPEPEDELSYAKRLQSDAAPAEKLKPQPEKSAPSPPAAAPGTTIASKPSVSRPDTPVASTSGHAGAWIVQLTALQDRAAAAALARRLSTKGYPAFVLDPAAGAPVIYRVQVGGYSDRREAEQAARRLEKDEQFKPIVRAR